MAKIMRSKAGPSQRPSEPSKPTRPSWPTPANDNVPKPANDNRVPLPRPRALRLGLNPLLGWAMEEYYKWIVGVLGKVQTGALTPLGYASTYCRAPNTKAQNGTGPGPNCAADSPGPTSLSVQQEIARINAFGLTIPAAYNKLAVEAIVGNPFYNSRSRQGIYYAPNGVTPQQRPEASNNTLRPVKPVLPPWINPQYPPFTPTPPAVIPAPYSVVPYLPPRSPDRKPDTSYGDKPKPIPNPRQAPKPREREIKMKLRGPKWIYGLQKLYHEYTEANDVIDAIYEALPENLRKGAEKARKKELKNAGKKQIIGPQDKLEVLYHNLDRVDLNEAFKNILKNQIEDAAVGAANQHVKKWADSNGIVLGPGGLSRNWGGQGGPSPGSPIDKVFEALEKYDF